MISSFSPRITTTRVLVVPGQASKDLSSRSGPMESIWLAFF
jgi:hypothetical protein